MMFWITDFPLPPSVNSYLMPVAGKTKFSARTKRHYTQGRLVKTKEHIDYEKRATYWILENREQVERIKEKIFFAHKASENDGLPFVLKVDLYFCFEHSRVLTVNNKIMQRDVDNFAKPAVDQLKKVFGIDDKHIFFLHLEKITAKNKDEECVIVRVSVSKPRTKQQIQDQIRSETSEPSP